MGVLTVGIPKNLMDKLDRISRENDLPKKMIKAGLDVMEPEVKRRLQASIQDKKELNGPLVESLKQSKPRMNSKGEWRGSLYFDGYDERGIPNNRKAMSMEWGTSKQVAAPFLRPAKEAKQKESESAMQAVFDAEVQK